MPEERPHKLVSTMEPVEVDVTALEKDSGTGALREATRREMVMQAVERRVPLDDDELAARDRQRADHEAREQAQANRQLRISEARAAIVALRKRPNQAALTEALAILVEEGVI